VVENIVERQGDLQGDILEWMLSMRVQWDIIFEIILKDNDLLHLPGQIYNVDETGAPLDTKAPNVIRLHGLKKVCTILS